MTGEPGQIEALIAALRRAAASGDRLAQHALGADPDPIAGLTRLWRERAERHGRLGAPGPVEATGRARGRRGKG